MKKVIMTVTAAGLIAVLSFMFFMAWNAGWALSGVSKQPTPATITYTVEKDGVTKTVEARKELPPVFSGEQAPAYNPNDREWTGDPQTWAQLQKIVRDGLQADRDVKLYANRGRSEELKGDLARYFSASSGALQSVQHTSDLTIQSAAGGYGRSESVITKMDFKGISIKDNQATVVADIYSHTCYKDFNTNRADGCPGDAKQHTVTLELENNQWLITKDLSVFLPGYGP